MFTVVHLTGADKAAQRQVLLIQLKATKALGQIGILCQQRAQQPGRLDVKRHHFFISTDRHHRPQAAMSAAGHGKRAAGKQSRGENPFQRKLILSRHHPAHERTLFIFSNHRNLIVIAAEIILRSLRLRAGQNGA